MKRAFKILAAIVVLLLAVVLALPFLIDVNQFRPYLEQQLSQTLRRTVKIGEIKLALLQGGVSASDLSISDDPAYSKDPFLTAKSLDIGVDMKTLVFDRKLHVKEVTIDGADVTLIQHDNGDWNFSSLAASSPEAERAAPPPQATPAPANGDSLDLSVQAIRVTNSRVRLLQPPDKHEFNDVNFELKDFSKTTAMPFTLDADAGGAGKIKIDGKAGPIPPTNTAETPFNANIQIDGLNLAKSGFINPASGMAGELTFKGDVNSDGKIAAAKGAVTIDKLKISKTGAVAPHPVAANIALAHDLKTRRGNIARSTLKLGAASANISGSYALGGASPSINATLNAPNMPLSEIVAFLPTFDVVLPTGATLDGGTISVDLTARGPAANPNATGQLKIENTTLKGYDLGSKLRFISQLAGISTSPTTPITLASVKFDSDPTIRNIREIVLNAPSIGQLTGSGVITPKQDLDFKMQAVVKTGGVLAAALAQRGETTTVPFFIKGNASNPTFSADVKSLANEKIQQVLKNPEGAIKNAKDAADTARGILDLFKKAPKQPQDTPQGTK
jgi:AsmA protein